MSDVNIPRSGSLGYKPKVRAERIYPEIDTWEETGELKPLGFGGYKVGMTRVLMIDDTEGATQGQEKAEPVTILEAPPLRVYGARFYT
ncbi:MAG: 50S ribosomal protein L3, partial [Candidatus Nanohaloarchaea archaeon]